MSAEIAQLGMLWTCKLRVVGSIPTGITILHLIGGKLTRPSSLNELTSSLDTTGRLIYKAGQPFPEFT